MLLLLSILLPLIGAVLILCLGSAQAALARGAVRWPWRSRRRCWR